MSRIRIGFLLVTLSTASACGASPLFHHDDARSVRGDGAIAKPVAGAPLCRVAFSPDLCASIDWAQGPTLRGESRLVLKFFNAQGAQIALGTKPTVTYDMEAMHHNIPPAVVNAAGDGAFTVGFYFSMGGEWTIKFRLVIDGVAYSAAYINKL